MMKIQPLRFGHIHIHDAYFDMGDGTGYLSMQVIDNDRFHTGLAKQVDPDFNPQDSATDILTIGFGPDGLFSKLDGHTRQTPPPEHRKQRNQLITLLYFLLEQADKRHPLDAVPTAEEGRGNGPRTVTWSKSCRTDAPSVLGVLTACIYR